MYDTLYGYPGAEAAGPAMGHPGSRASSHPGPTPSPYPPSPMVPGPSMHPGECGCSSGGSQAMEGPPVAEGHGSAPGHTDCNGAAFHPGTGTSGHAHPGSPSSAQMHHPPLHEAYHYGYYPPDAQVYDGQGAPGYSLFGLNLSDGNFWKGALIGAAVTLLVTNDTVQKTIMKGVAVAYSSATAAVGELKEKFEDAQAEMGQSKE